jgi:hypothetical protein
MFLFVAGSTSGDPPKMQSKLSDANLTGASLLSDGEQMEEVAHEAEERESQVSSRKSSYKEEVTPAYKVYYIYVIFCV